MFPKKIIDIYLKKGNIGIERSLNLNSTEIITIIEKFQYSGEKLLIDDSVENAKLPPFIVAFYYFLYSKLTIPTEEQLYSCYIFINKLKEDGEHIKIKSQNFKISSIKARMLRTFPSLIRDIHFYTVLSEDENFENVEYSLTVDYYDGLDIKFDFNQKTYFASIFIATNRGSFFKKAKAKRHNYDNVLEIELEVSFDSLEKHGRFYLLGNEQVEQLIKILKSKK